MDISIIKKVMAALNVLEVRGADNARTLSACYDALNGYCRSAEREQSELKGKEDNNGNG